MSTRTPDGLMPTEEHLTSLDNAHPLRNCKYNIVGMKRFKNNAMVSTEASSLFAPSNGERQLSSKSCSFGGLSTAMSKSETKRMMPHPRRRKIMPIVPLTSNGTFSSQTRSSSSAAVSTSCPKDTTKMRQPTPTAMPSSSSRIRSRYFQRLGVVGPSSPTQNPQRQRQEQQPIPCRISTHKIRRGTPKTPISPPRGVKTLTTTEVLKDGLNSMCDDHLLHPPPSLTCIQEEEEVEQRELQGNAGHNQDTTVSCSSSPSIINCHVHEDQRSEHETSHEEEEKEEDEDEPQSYMDDTASYDSSSHHSVVSFDSTVTVHYIPKRDEYSNRTKHSMWMPPEEMQINAARNVLEFAAENWDWRQATEEKDMIFVDDAVLVHPVHVNRHCNLQRQFLMIMSAQQAGKL